MGQSDLWFPWFLPAIITRMPGHQNFRSAICKHRRRPDDDAISDGQAGTAYKPGDWLLMHLKSLLISTAPPPVTVAELKPLNLNR